MSTHSPAGGAFRTRLAARRRRSGAATGLLAVAMVVTLAILVWVLVYVAVQGVQSLSPSFLVDNPPGNPGSDGGGFFNGILGSLIVVGIATAIALPVGVGGAIYLSEFGRGRFAASVNFLNDVLTGIPTIVTGAFVYALWVTHFGFSGLAGSIALAIVMLPLIVRTTAQMLALVPRDLREASHALGATTAQTILRTVLPAASSGIITGIMLAVARAMGETAPLLLTALGNDLFTEANPSKRMSTLSLQIFGNAVTGFHAAQARAWAGALTLIAIVLVLTTAARFFARSGRMTTP